MQNKNFRRDINGLRAIAVIAVVLFHFNASWMPGGFAGVDVFFVISGFLMTGIIFKGIEQEHFSVLKFYVARANRIIPALAVLCLSLSVFGWFYLTPIEYEALGKHIASSVTFLSNMVYWKEAGYFDAASHEKWLLHTWSLSVEWQFYILYPLVLVALCKFMSIKAMKYLLLIGTILGFILCIISTYKWPNPSYYLLPTRAWEMMMGGIAFLFPFQLQEHKKKLMELLGIALILASYIFISAENLWPGYLAIFPVLGAFLLIQANRQNSVITNNVVFQKIGTWSYSIYLWHWPLVVAIYIFALSEEYLYLGILLSIILGFLSYHFIERIKFQNDFTHVLSYLKCKPIYCSGLLCLIGILLFSKQYDLMPFRLSNEEIVIVEQQKRDPREAFCGNVVNGISPECKYGTGPVKAVVIGDSHSQAQNMAIGERASLAGGSIVSFGLSGCPTIKNSYSYDEKHKIADDNCGKLIANAIKITAQKYPNIPIIVINRNSQYLFGHNENKDFHLKPPVNFVDQEFDQRNAAYLENISAHMINTLCEFSEHHQVYLTRPTPELITDVPKTMFRRLALHQTAQHLKISREAYMQRQQVAFDIQNKAVQRCGVKLLDPLPYLCDSQYCYGDKNGIPLYFDDDHLSTYGSKLVAPIYDEVFQ
ncbi:acyltransferase family protein [Acinetobacter shaoyimingii]|uniref:Acyltransferase n=1 Tax=Acinetobacter shaoyimingii TaxID=2715164 RepID=A0A6G8RZF6_9GAMM|nr:acyltransferase family protein [Acinetobacter shaoyimingii]QIO07244.1 acyltransferase [Acinetobacter shaoyimingii]